MDRCHRCKSEWFVPELTPPAWRVLDGAGQIEQEETSDESPIAGAEKAECAENVEDAEQERSAEETGAE